MCEDELVPTETISERQTSTFQLPHSVSVSNFAPRQQGASHTVGTFHGVFVCVMVNTINVVYFSRLPYVIGVSGGESTFYGLLLTFILVLITVSSLSVISSNGEIEGGGSYYVISRTIGPASGASCGVSLSMASIFGATTATMAIGENIAGLYDKPLIKTKRWDACVYSCVIGSILIHFVRFAVQIRIVMFFRDYCRIVMLLFRTLFSSCYTIIRFGLQLKDVC